MNLFGWLNTAPKVVSDITDKDNGKRTQVPSTDVQFINYEFAGR